MFWSENYTEFKNDEEGSSLLSALILLMFTSFLMLSSATVLKNQVVQYRQTALSYEARTMIEMTEVLLKDGYEAGQLYPSEVEFSSGRTSVNKLTDTRFLIKAELNNQYTSQKTVELVLRPAEPNSTLEDDEQNGYESVGDEDRPILE